MNKLSVPLILCVDQLLPKIGVAFQLGCGGGVTLPLSFGGRSVTLPLSFSGRSGVL